MDDVTMTSNTDYYWIPLTEKPPDEDDCKHVPFEKVKTVKAKFKKPVQMKPRRLELDDDDIK